MRPAYNTVCCLFRCGCLSKGLSLSLPVLKHVLLITRVLPFPLAIIEYRTTHVKQFSRTISDADANLGRHFVQHPQLYHTISQSHSDNALALCVVLICMRGTPYAKHINLCNIPCVWNMFTFFRSSCRSISSIKSNDVSESLCMG